MKNLNYNNLCELAIQKNHELFKIVHCNLLTNLEFENLKKIYDDKILELENIKNLKNLEKS